MYNFNLHIEINITSNLHVNVKSKTNLKSEFFFYKCLVINYLQIFVPDHNIKSTYLHIMRMMETNVSFFTVPTRK